MTTAGGSVALSGGAPAGTWWQGADRPDEPLEVCPLPGLFRWHPAADITGLHTGVQEELSGTAQHVTQCPSGDQPAVRTTTSNPRSLNSLAAWSLPPENS